MASRIILCGASSTGKTTLANDWCSKHKDFEHIQEIARDIMKANFITREDLLASLKTRKKECFFKLQCLILKEQNRREMELAGKPFISDRGPDPFAYVSMHMGPEGVNQLVGTSEAKGYLHRCRESLIVLLCPLQTATDDGFRMVPTKKEQMEFTKEMRGILRQYNVPHVYIDITDRGKRMLILEKSARGNFVFETKLLDQYPLSIPFLLHRKPSQNKAIRTLMITPESLITKFTPFSSETKTNRMVDRYGEDRFILLDFENRDVAAELVRKVLLKGVLVNGEEYHFLGCSSSGLKKRTCYMLRGSAKEVETVLSECGDFSAIKTVSKKLKRIGLLFSEAGPTRVQVPPEQVMYKEDIKSGGLNFTDGCGAVSVELAKKFLEGIQGVDVKYLPSVLQIRYGGCKGVVMVDPNLKGAKQLVIRESMKKFNPGSKPFQEMWLCNWSQPYSYGNLNCQFIMLFSALGVETEVFLQKQREHFEQLERMTDDPDVAAKMLLWRNEPDLASRVAKYSSDSRNEFKGDQHLQNELTRLQNKLYSKLEKLHLLIPESRNVFGVCDPLNVLQYGECFFRPTVRGSPMTLRGKVRVAKNPCYLLGDVRVLTCVSDSRTRDLEHLVDCLVFPTQGKRPHPMEIAGSDLDGDQYFVCWDPDLIVPTLHEPYDYPSVEATLPEVSKKRTIEFFAQQKQTNMMGKIDWCFKYWARVLGVDSDQCRKLGMLFSRSVDAAKTGDIVTIPPNLRPPKETTSTPDCSSKKSPQPVWQIMEDAAKTCLCNRSKIITIAYPDDHSVGAGVTEEFVRDLVQDKQVNISEFRLFQFVNAWCHNQPLSDDQIFKKLLEFSEYINFGKFTVDEQRAAIDMGIPQPMVTNALNKCKLLSPIVLDYFSLRSPHCGWHFYFRSDRVEFKWDHLLRAIQRHNESLIFFEISDGVIAGLHFLKKFETGETELEEGTVVAYFFSTDFDYKLRHVLGPQYTLRLDNELLQLYRNKNQHQTFLWLRSEFQKKRDEETLFDIISIDLTRFIHDTRRHHPLLNKQCFQTVEVFVKSDTNDSTSFDLLEADQPHDLSPERIELLDELEELPSEEDTQVEQESVPITLESYSLETALSLLQKSAIKGNCSHFLSTLQLILSTEKSKIPLPVDFRNPFMDLLANVGIANSHWCIPHIVLQELQTIIISLQRHFQSPMCCLQILGGLGQLHCFELLGQVTMMLLPNLCMSQASEFLETLSHWKLWCFLPQITAHSVATRLHTLSKSLLSQTAAEVNTSKQTDGNITTRLSLAVLAAKTDLDTTVDDLEVERYTCHFAYLILCHFIDEVASIQNQIGRSDPAIDTDMSVVKLRAYDFNDPHQTEERESSSGEHLKDEHCANVWKVGFSRIQSIKSAKFTVGTYVAISVMTRPKSSENIELYPVAIGHIVHVARNPADIVVEVPEPASHGLKHSARLHKGHWQIRLLGNVTTFIRTVKALHTLLDSKQTTTPLLPLLIHPDGFQTSRGNSTVTAESSVSEATAQAPLTAVSAADSVPKVSLQPVDDISMQHDPAIHADISLLNPSQKKAAQAALTQRLTLIHGPPGTGKTYIACEIVNCVLKQISKAEGTSILVTAETNMAVDNLTRRLLQMDLLVVRVGDQGQISPDIRHVSLEQQIERKRLELDKERRKSSFLDQKMAKDILKAADVVATTCAGAGDALLKKSRLKFSFVIIDEATQVTEPVSLLPLVYGCKQLTLIGDPKQLAPTLPGHTPHTVEEQSVKELAVTLFHRLHKVLPSFFLQEQHRMHPELATFPSEKFYDGQLKTVASLYKQPTLNFIFFTANRPLAFIDVKSLEQRVGTSFQNFAEAKVVVEIVKYLLTNEVSPLEIAVLTPYISQVRCICKHLSPVSTKVEVCSVDSFQGREKSKIVFSTVRSNSTGNLGFTDDQFRMNVLLTRAKHCIIGVGCKDTLSRGSDMWYQWLNQCTILSEEEFKKKIELGKKLHRYEKKAPTVVEGGHRAGPGDDRKGAVSSRKKFVSQGKQGKFKTYAEPRGLDRRSPEHYGRTHHNTGSPNSGKGYGSRHKQQYVKGTIDHGGKHDRGHHSWRPQRARGKTDYSWHGENRQPRLQWQTGPRECRAQDWDVTEQTTSKLPRPIPEMPMYHQQDTQNPITRDETRKSSKTDLNVTDNTQQQGRYQQQRPKQERAAKTTAKFETEHDN